MKELDIDINLDQDDLQSLNSVSDPTATVITQERIVSSLDVQFPPPASNTERKELKVKFEEGEKKTEQELKGFVMSYNNKKSLLDLKQQLEIQFNNRGERHKLQKSFKKEYKSIDYENSKLKESLDNYSF